MAMTPVVVTHAFVNADGTPASGTVRFSLSARMTNGGVSVMPSQPLTASLSSGGLLSQSVLANDDVATTPTGTSWQVTLAVTGCSEETYEITVPSTAPSGTVDLGALLPTGQQVG